jgi:MoaA/NifB/PqqE/SkfB family radical SAM enzyme
MTTRDDRDDVLAQTVAVQEDAAHERRHWVRISNTCNNRCCFCLDADLVFLDPFVSTNEVQRQIDDGRVQGATRLILSGGEASIHPDFVELVRYGRQAGYDRVQTITNGRMFTYSRFFREAMAAGLGEITFSLHSHRAHIHDQITGVKGSFDQALRALRWALDEPGLIVSVDVVINRLNVSTLPETVGFFADLGVGEFDLLHLVPFGRAFSPELGTVPLAVEIGVLRDRLARTIELAAERSLVLWTNRLPAPALEGYEHLIQDPHKLLDEVRGRREHMTRLVETGTPLPCRDERCDCCYLIHFCDRLHPLQDRVASGDLDALRVTVSAGEPVRDLTPWTASLRHLWVCAPDAAQARALPVTSADEVWELGTVAGLTDGDPFGAHRVRRLVVRRGEDVAPALATGVAQVKLLLGKESYAWVLAQQRLSPRQSPRLVLGIEVPERLSAVRERAIDLRDPGLREIAARGVTLEDLPPCLGGVLPVDGAPWYVDLAALDDRGRLDPDRYVEQYIRHEYCVKSLRCNQCVHHLRCPGLHVNLVRAQGFAVLEPEIEPEIELP